VSSGRLRSSSLVPRDVEGFDFIRKVNADLCIIGSCKIHPEIGLSTDNYDEAAVKEVMINTSSKVVAVLTSDNLGRKGHINIAMLDKLTYILLNGEVTDEMLVPYKAKGIQIINN
jgi:DeoR/GlpR family transcriptional regulator of sugar metabolism